MFDVSVEKPLLDHGFLAALHREHLNAGASSLAVRGTQGQVGGSVERAPSAIALVGNLRCAHS